MRQKYCTACGATLSEGIKFCEICGTLVDTEMQAPSLQPPASAGEEPMIPPITPPLSRGTGKVPVKIIAGIFIVLIIATAVILIVVPKMSSGSSQSPIGPALSASTVSSTTSVPKTTMPATVTPKPDLFPNALPLKEGFRFGEGNIASEGTVYRIWMNETYFWHNDMDSKYYIQKPKPGYKYLFLFINVFNKGDIRIWPPTSGNINIYYNGQKYSADPTHYLPDKSSDPKATAIEVKEIQYFPKLFGTEYVEDFGYSHGILLAYLYPGRSNAIDGYLVFEVPASLSPENAYAEIAFNGNTVGVWKLV
jgi:hypothetical protein